MKKLKVLALVVCLLTMINLTSTAQTKIGYIDQETILYLMPEAKVADSLVRKYQLDTIGKEYQAILENYQFNDSVSKDISKSQSVRDEAARKTQEYAGTLTNWQQIASEATQAKQQQLFTPLMVKIKDAIAAVAKEKGYAYVLASESLVIAPDADNLIVPVLTKLKIAIPPQLQPGYKPKPGGN